MAHLLQFQVRQRLERAARLFAPLGFERTQIAPLPQLAAMLVDHAEVHEVVRREHVDLDVGPNNIHGGGIAHHFQQYIHQTAAAKLLGRIQHFGKLGGGVGQRHQSGARALVQCLEQGLYFFFEHAGNQPFAALLVHLVQHKQRHGHG